jgi:hypothetical protein
MRTRALILVLVVLFLAGGCTVMTTAQKDWVKDKSNRSTAYVALMDKGQTTSEQDREWIRSQDASWKLWADKVENGFAAPSWMVGGDK